jgi:N-acetyl-anhydromuramyl-L-alanine amidase AmpD
MTVASPGAAQTKKKQTATKSSPAPKKSSASATRKPTSTAKKPASTRRAAATKKAPPKKADPRRYAQKQPTPERYREIQDALAERGYLATESRGTWDDSSTSALRRFQQDQNLDANGKIDSLSLIALGLGPKRGTPQKLQP